MKTAFFVKYLRRIEELHRIHLANNRKHYEIVKQVILDAIDYENFATDMGVGRAFIRHGAALYAEGETMKCLLVCQRGREDGVLVMGEDGEYVKWAAHVVQEG